MTPRFLVLVACSLIVLSAAGLSAAEFHVKTTGTAGGDGSLANPWDLQTALNQPASVKPGDTIWVHGGTYQGTFSSQLTGTAAAPIIVRQAIGERATIDNGSPGDQVASITANGPYTWFWGLELMSSDPVRVSSQTGSFPTDIMRGTCCYPNAQGVKMINMVCHDGFNGTFAGNTSPDAECYGNLIYNNGWDAPDRGHGHSIYWQNQTGGKKIYDNIHFNQFNHSIHIYGSGNAYLNNFDIEGNIGFNNGYLQTGGAADNYICGGGIALENSTIKDNMSYFSPAGGAGGSVGADELGWTTGMDSTTMTGNYFGETAGGVDIEGTNLTVTGNTFICWISFNKSNYPNNDYTWASWSGHSASGPPTGTKIVIRPNAYEPGRANICIFNWDKNDSVSLELSSVLNAGDTFELLDAQNFYGPAAVGGTFTGAAVSVPMTLTAIAQPIGNAPWPAVHTPKEFQVFVLLRTGNSPTQLGFGPPSGVQPSNTTAGVAISPAVVVAAYDAAGNLASGATNSITLSLGNNPGGAALSGTLTRNAVNGLATFNDLTLDKAASGYTLIATSNGLTSATSSNFNVAPAALDHFLVENAGGGSVPSQTAGTPFNIKITAQDAFNNTVTSFAGTVQITSNGALTGAPVTSGSFTSGMLSSQSLTITSVQSNTTVSVSGQGKGGTSNTFAVTPGAEAQLAFAVQPSNTTAGATISPSPQVKIQDAFGNTVTSANDNVTVAIQNNPGSGALSGTLTVAAVNGVATFGGLSINKAGTGYTLAASSGTLTGAVSAAFNIVAGAPAQLAFAVQPSNTTAGATISPSPQVKIQDAFGNTVTSANGNVIVAIQNNPGSGTLSGTLTVAAVNGVATFGGLSINKAGTGYTLAASSGTLTGAVSAAFNIVAGAKAQLAFAVQPSNTTAGATISPSPQVTIQDAFGNTVTAANDNVTVAIQNNPGSGTLSGTLTVAAVNGVATFGGLSINKAGTGYTLAASSGTLTGTVSAAFNIVAGAEAQLAFAVQPSNTTAGATISPSPQVTIQDAFGNTVTVANDNVTVAIQNNPGSGTLSGTLTVAAVNGVATFGGLSINKAGAGYTLAASSGTLTGTVSAGFNIVAGAAAQLAFAVQPSNTTVGATISPSPQVTIQDAFGNTVTAANGNVTVGIQDNPGSGTLSGTLTVAAVNGVATFGGLSINKPGAGYTLAASSGTLTGTVSARFNILGPAAQLAFTVQPGDSEAGGAVTPAPQVTVQDAGGNTVASADNSITVAIGNNPNGGTLSGTVAVAASSGVAVFNNLSIDRVGNGYTLTASATGLASGTSSAFQVVHTTPPVIGAPTTSVPLSVLGQQVSFTVSATDPLPITYTWNFGDGTSETTSNPTISHPFSAAGTYSVTVTAADSGGLSSSANVTQVVAAALQVQLITGRLAFPSSLSKDSLSLKAIIQLEDGFSPAGQVVQWQLGGIAGTVTLDKKGNSPRSSRVKVSLRFKKPAKGKPFTARAGKLAIMLRKQSLGQIQLGAVKALNENSVNPKGDPATIDAFVIFTGEQSYGQLSIPVAYKAKLNKFGSFLGKFKVH